MGEGKLVGQEPNARGHWQAPRLLMFVGAVLGAVFGLLMFVPGMVPWWDYSSPYAAWWLGVVSGFGLGFALGILYWRVLLAKREQPSGAVRTPQV
jgi:hypothetical protein